MRGRLVVLVIALLAISGPPTAEGRPSPEREAAGVESVRGESSRGESPRAASAPKKSVRRYPWDKRLRRASRYARRRSGAVSFAVVDELGRIHGHRRGRRYSSASLVKAMLLVAYLRKGDVRKRGLHAAERAQLGPMIRASDNGAADAIFARVGTSGLARVGRRAGMKRFQPSPAWGGSQVTARDQARFFAQLRRLLPDRHRSYALGLLAGVVGGQRWGIPRGRPSGWRAHFKGGWYPGGGGWRVHQGALLQKGGRRLAVAVLTEGGSGLGYGSTTIREVTKRLLRGYNRYRRPGKKR